MVKKRQDEQIRLVRFARGRARPLGAEVIDLRRLIEREPRGDLTRPQRTTFHLLMLVTGGRGAHIVDFQRHRLSPGSVLHVAPGQVQQFSLNRALDAPLLVFEPDFVRRAPSLWPGPRPLPVVRRRTVAALFDGVAREWAASDGSAGSRALLAALVEAVVLAVDGAAPPAPSTSGQRLLRDFFAALEKDFARAREVAAYAAGLRCSARTVARLCERATGRSAKQLIDERVVLEAKRLLAHGRQPAAQIAAQLGFAEPTQFGKYFRRIAGETPAAFRAAQLS